MYNRKYNCAIERNMEYNIEIEYNKTKNKFQR